jgi:hypothetical protein
VLVVNRVGAKFTGCSHTPSNPNKKGRSAVIGSSGKSFGSSILDRKSRVNRLAGELDSEALSKNLSRLSTPKTVGGNMAELWIKQPQGWVSLGVVSTVDLALAQAEVLKRLLPERVFKVSIYEESYACS